MGCGFVHGDKELAEKLGKEDPLRVRVGAALSSVAAVTQGAFDGALRGYYVRD